jgi:MoxR-like ATPase
MKSDRKLGEAELNKAKETCGKILEETQKVVVGKEELLENIMVCLLSRGHVLLEGVPGIAKTTIATSFAQTLGCEFGRIQFTPDLLPTDITGTFIFRADTSDFALRKGPIFANIVLADEINRAPPKTQAALLECMQEGQATIEGKTYGLEPPFMVIATQNPIEQEGTYPLPEAQIDRFLMRLNVDYPNRVEERDILRRFNKDLIQAITRVCTPADIINIQESVKSVHAEDGILDYIVDLIFSTRENQNVLLGGSPRASISLLLTAKAKAVLHGRDYIIPDDVKYVAPHVLNHRIILRPEAELDGMRSIDVINQTLDSIEVR